MVMPIVCNTVLRVDVAFLDPFIILGVNNQPIELNILLILQHLDD